MSSVTMSMRDRLRTARPRHLGRSETDFEKAFAYHCNYGRAYTHLPIALARSAIEGKAAEIHRWSFVDIMEVADGLKLPKKAGLYGFFNLDEDSEPLERVLYIGKSKKLSSRVTKNHSKFLLALRNRASHIGFISVTDRLSADVAEEVIGWTETTLIQHWSPYLNIEENYFNFEVEARLP